MSNGRYSLMGPAVLITVGAVFLLHQWRPDLHMGRLWPVILIVIGAIRLASSLAPMEGHVYSSVTPAGGPPAPGPPAPPTAGQGI